MASEKKADNLIDTLLSIGRVGLLLIGIIGLAINFFKDDGIFKTILKKMFASTTSMIVSAVVIGILYMLNRWLSTADGKASKKGDLPLYAMMALGAYFLWKLMETGSF